jgi:hypothetical protein
MTTLTAPAPTKTAKSLSEQPTHLFQLGVLFVIRVSYWPCRAGNERAELNLTQDGVARKAVASFDTKDLIDPEKGRRILAFLEQPARQDRKRRHGQAQPGTPRDSGQGDPLGQPRRARDSEPDPPYALAAGGSGCRKTIVMRAASGRPWLRCSFVVGVAPPR